MASHPDVGGATIASSTEPSDAGDEEPEPRPRLVSLGVKSLLFGALAGAAFTVVGQQLGWWAFSLRALAFWAGVGALVGIVVRSLGYRAGFARAPTGPAQARGGRVRERGGGRVNRWWGVGVVAALLLSAAPAAGEVEGPCEAMIESTSVDGLDADDVDDAVAGLGGLGLLASARSGYQDGGEDALPPGEDPPR